MRRHAMMGIAFVVPLAVSFLAVAQPKPAAKKPATGAAASAAAATSSAAGATSAAPATSGTPTGAVSAAPATSAAPAGAASAAAPGSSTPPSSGAVAAPSLEGATYAVRLRDLESRVDDLKDQIRRSHTRLSLLSDTIMSGGAAGARAEVTFVNEMTSAFRLTRALFVIDGAVHYNRQDETGALADLKEIPVFSGSVPPGDHTVQALLNFQGNGFGVFTYLRGYKFEVRSSHSFTVAEGKTMTVSAVALERGGVTTPMEQRPAIEWKEKIQAIGTQGGAAAAAAGANASGTGASAGGSLSVGGGNP